MILNIENQNYITELIEKYEENPLASFAQHVIEPPLDSPNIGKVFIWCPLSQQSITINCQVHKETLQLGPWTSELLVKNNKNPRKIYDLFGNIILIQRLYYCSGIHSIPSSSHYILSSDYDVMNQLPINTKDNFVFKKHHQSIFSFKFIDYVFDQVVRGVNFSQIAESIATLHYSDFKRREKQISITTKFTDNDLYSFPSGDKIINIFLDEFEQCKTFYLREMESISPGKVISTDHTFKVGKNKNKK